MNPIISKINEINWSAIIIKYDWTTEISGNAEDIGTALRDLYSNNIDLAMEATHSLWCKFSQHSYISSATLPTYDFLIIGLDELEEKLKVELLDIFLGFAVYTEDVFHSDTKCDLLQWEMELYNKLKYDIDKFKKLTNSSNKSIAYFSNEIVSYITKGHSHWSPPEGSESRPKDGLDDYFIGAIHNPNYDVRINRLSKEDCE